MAGRMPDEGPGGIVRLDLVLSEKDECSGTLRYDEQFFRAQDAGMSAEEIDAGVDLLAGTWVKTLYEDPNVKKIKEFCTLEKAFGGRDLRSNATRGETTTIDGTPAIALPEKNSKEHVTAYVATKGTPCILRLQATPPR